jgi:methionyl-tRNA synthetase
VAAGQAVEAYRADLDAIDLTDGFAAAIGLVRAVDGFIERTAPFKLARDPAMKGRVGTILYECAEALRIAALLMWPAMPDRMAEVCRRLGFSEIEAVTAGGAGNLSAWAEWGGLKPGATVAQGEGLFARYVPAATS